ncbi:MAG: hypothetical protein ABSD52_13385 [Candidatus Cybelea sp.]
MRHRSRRANRRLRSAAACQHCRSDAAAERIATKIQALHLPRSLSVNGSTATVRRDPLSVISDYARPYQLIRQRKPIVDGLFEIELLEPGLEALDFTFG